MASFKEAFAAARKKLGAGKTFEWNGKSYSTNLKEEVSKPASAAPTKSIRPKAKTTAAPKPATDLTDSQRTSLNRVGRPPRSVLKAETQGNYMTTNTKPKSTSMSEKNVAALKALGSKFLTKTPAGAPNRADVIKKKKK